MIHEQLTVEENLQFIGKLKGLTKECLEANVNLVIDMMDLEGFR